MATGMFLRNMIVQWREIDRRGETVVILAKIVVENGEISHDQSFVSLRLADMKWQFRTFYLEGHPSMIRVALALMGSLNDYGCILTSLKREGGTANFFRFNSSFSTHHLGNINLPQHLVTKLTYSLQFEFKVIASAGLQSSIGGVLAPVPLVHDVVFIFPHARAKSIGTMRSLLAIHSDVLHNMFLENPYRPDFYVFHLKYEAVKIAFIIISGQQFTIKAGMVKPLMRVYRSWRIEAVLTAVENAVDNFPVSLCTKLQIVGKWKIDLFKDTLLNHLRICPLCCLLVRNDNKFHELSESSRESVIASLTDHLNNWKIDGRKMQRFPGICPRCETDEADVVDTFCAYSPLDEEEDLD